LFGYLSHGQEAIADCNIAASRLHQFFYKIFIFISMYILLRLASPSANRQWEITAHKYDTKSRFVG